MHVAAIIATSCQRWATTLERSLASVVAQQGVWPNTVEIIVVDDNKHPDEIIETRRVVAQVMSGAPAGFSAIVLPNVRTKGYSGTGAWNTAVDDLISRGASRSILVLFLDDDDAWTPLHVARCVDRSAPRVMGVFEDTLRICSGSRMRQSIRKSELTVDSFFVGNPGIQTGNICLRLGALMDVGGFDESLRSATDRDLMIRLLRHFESELGAFVLTHRIGLHYFADHDGRVSCDLEAKQVGLDAFYAKHWDFPHPELWTQSFERASRLFGYRPARER